MLMTLMRVGNTHLKMTGRPIFWLRPVYISMNLEEFKLFKKIMESPKELSTNWERIEMFWDFNKATPKDLIKQIQLLKAIKYPSKI